MAEFSFPLMVAVVVTVFVASVTFLLSSRREDAEADIALGAAKALDDFFIYSIGSLRSILVLENMNGDALMVREMLEVKPNRSTQLVYVGGYVNGSGPLTRDPVLLDASLPGQRYTFEASGAETKRAHFSLHLNPPLVTTESLSYKVQLHFAGLHQMRRSDVRRTYRKDLFRYEYSGIKVDTPVNDVIIEVRFPDGFEVKAFPVAFYGLSEVIARQELKRSDTEISWPEPSLARMIVRKPTLTFHYALAWMPRR